jgi:restriction system protein
MAEVTQRRTGELLRRLFRILLDHPEGLQAGVALEQLAKSVTLTSHESGIYESTGSRRFEKIVRFATVDCVKAGWLLKNKGTWLITDEGKAAYQKISDPEAFYREATRLYRVWKSLQPKDDAASEADDVSKSAGESPTITFEEAEEQAWSEIERYLGEMNPYEFQELVGDLLRAIGYFVPWIAPQGKDGGVDLIAFTDPLGIKPPRIKIQVKRRGDKVDVVTLRAFLATISDVDVGLFVSTGGFTRDDEEFARNQERRTITLIDSKRLLSLWIQHFKTLDDAARRRLPLTPIYFLTPET